VGRTVKDFENESTRLFDEAIYKVTKFGD